MKIKCSQCVNESDSKCLVSKSTIKLNKSRKCNDYVFDQKKELRRLELKAIAMDNQDAAFVKKRMAAESRVVNDNIDKFKSTAA